MQLESGDGGSGGTRPLYEAGCVKAYALLRLPTHLHEGLQGLEFDLSLKP